MTLGVAVTTGDFGKLAWYSAAQLAGAMAGACLVWLHYLPHWRETPAPGAKRACFCTDPAIRNAPANLLSEVIGTFVLVLVAGAIFSKAVAATGPAAALGPYLVGSLVWGIGLSLGGTTGYAINVVGEPGDIQLCRLGVEIEVLEAQELHHGVRGGPVLAGVLLHGGAGGAGGGVLARHSSRNTLIGSIRAARHAGRDAAAVAAAASIAAAPNSSAGSFGLTP